MIPLSLTLTEDGFIVIAQLASIDDITMLNLVGFGNVLPVFSKGSTTFQHDGDALEYWISNLSQRGEETVTYDVER